MVGFVLDDREIKVERARRSTGYEKTPGRYLGPPQNTRRRDGSRERGGGGGGYSDYRGPPRGYGGDRGYDRGYDRDYRGPPPSRGPPYR